MNALRLTTILCVAISLPHLAFAKGKPPKDDPPAEAPATYTAELTAGDFVFVTGELLGLTADRKGKSLSGDFRLEMVPESAFAWDYIFTADCSALLSTSGHVAGFGVLANDWGISFTKSRRSLDQIHITMNNLMIYPGTSANYDHVDFDLHLHGEIADGTDFLPESSNAPVFHQLTRYKLWAGAAGPQGFTCNSAGSGIDDWATLQTTNTLKITRVEP